MATEKDYQNLYDRIAALRETVTGRLAADLIQNPQLADALVKQIDDLLAGGGAADGAAPAPAGSPPARARTPSTSSIGARCSGTRGATAWRRIAACSATGTRPCPPA